MSYPFEVMPYIALGIIGLEMITFVLVNYGLLDYIKSKFRKESQHEGGRA